MTENEYKYWAFLSYSQRDNSGPRSEAPALDRLAWGDWLREALKTFPVPVEFAGQINSRGEIIPERIEAIFQDESEAAGDATLSAVVRQALEQSRCLIVLCSPQSAQSQHVNEVVRYFKQIGRGNRILPLVIAGEPNASEAGWPETECFVPAMRHPLQPDGTLDTTRQEGRYIIADARHGAEKQEILAKDLRHAETELEIAKLQLIAGLIGVGFNGLLRREQKRRFVGFAEAQQQVREVLGQLEAVRQQLREAQSQALAGQNLPPDVHRQIQAAQEQAAAAQTQAREAQQQFQEWQSKARETQGLLEEARQQVRAAESRVQDAQAQARHSEGQIEEARRQAREAQSQLETAQNQLREAQGKVLEAQQLPSDAQSQAAGNQAQNIQHQLDEAREQVQASEARWLAAQQEVQADQGRVEELQNQAREAQNQLEAARNQVTLAESKILATQAQAREAQTQLQEIQNQTRDVQGQIQKAQAEAAEARCQLQSVQGKSQAARRLTKVLAVIAVLTALAAGITATIAWRQRTIVRQALAKVSAVEVGEFQLAPGTADMAQIRLTLSQIGGWQQSTNRLRSLDELAAQIPPEQISNTLNLAADILVEPPRAHFQEQLLARWLKTDLPGAFGWACALTNMESRRIALEKVISALPVEDFANTLARLNALKPLPDAALYSRLFQRWSAQNPMEAITHRQELPDHDADHQVLNEIMATWTAQAPQAALAWLQSPTNAQVLSSETLRRALVVDLFNTWVAKDLAAAATAGEQLPEGLTKEKVSECVLNIRITKVPASAAAVVNDLPANDYRQKAIVALSQSWATNDVSAALAWAQSLTNSVEQLAALNQVVASWAGKDPSAAAQFADQHNELSAGVVGGIANAWFQRDAVATTNWIAGLSSEEKKATAQMALAEAWAQSDPQGLAAYALSLPAGDVQTKLLSAACLRLADQDFSGAAEVVQPLSNAALRQSLLDQAARHCDLAQLPETAKYISAMPAGDDQNAAIQGLLTRWSPVNPGAALNWLSAFPETNAQPKLVESVIKTWAQTEPALAAQWLADQPSGTNRDEIVGAFLAGAVAKYPEFAAQWTQSVADEAQRQKYELQVAKGWLLTDSASAGKWIESLNLPEALKQSLKPASP